MWEHAEEGWYESNDEEVNWNVNVTLFAWMPLPLAVDWSNL